jgi:hypothetical protein
VIALHDRRITLRTTSVTPSPRDRVIEPHSYSIAISRRREVTARLNHRTSSCWSTTETKLSVCQGELRELGDVLAPMGGALESVPRPC